MNPPTGTTEQAPTAAAAPPGEARPPLITIITVCRNSAATIGKTTTSILEQHYQDWEWLVVDGASTDDTCDLVRNMVGDDPRVSIISEPDKGIFDAMNKSVPRAVGGYLNFLNSDDRYAGPTVLEEVAAALRQQPGTDFLYGNIYVEAADGTSTVFRPPGPEAAPDEMVCGCLPHQAIFARRALFAPDRIGLFDVNLRYGADYKWMMDVMADASLQLLHLDKELAFFYNGGNSSHLEGCLPESFRILNSHTAFQQALGLPRILLAYQKQVLALRLETAKLHDEVHKRRTAHEATRAKLAGILRQRDEFKAALKAAGGSPRSATKGADRLHWLPSWLRF